MVGVETDGEPNFVLEAFFFPVFLLSLFIDLLPLNKFSVFFSSIESSISFLSPIFPPLSPSPVCPDEHPSSTSMPSNDSPVSDWYYLRLALTPDPELFQSLPSLYEELQVDLLTWRSLVSTALVDFYGLVGQARHFDILTHEKTRPGLQSIIRIQKEDVDVFCTSINNYSFGLGDYFGSKYTMNGRVVVAEQLAFLGMVSPMATR